MKTNHINFINFVNPELWEVVADVWDELTCFLKECRRAKIGDIVAYCRGFVSSFRFNIFRDTETTLLFKELHGQQIADILLLIDQITSIEYEGRSENPRGEITSEYHVTLENGVEFGIHL